MQKMINWLAYKAYEYNRLKSPHIDPVRWRAIFEDGEEFEKIFENNIKTIQQQGAWGA